MTFRSDVSREAKFRERRRGARLNSTVTLALEWQMEGQNVREDVKTRIVNPYGCMVIIPQDLPLEQKVRVTNLLTNAAHDALVVWKGNQRAEGWETGIELVNPAMDFWGLDL